jgi:hypothetical protein
LREERPRKIKTESQSSGTNFSSLLLLYLSFQMGSGQSKEDAAAPPRVTANREWVQFGPRLIRMKSIAFVAQRPDNTLEIRMLCNSSVNRSDSSSVRGTDAFKTRPLSAEEIATFWSQLTGESSGVVLDV